MARTAADGGLPPLNSDNLRKLSGSDLNKEAYLQSYIRAQEAYLSSYALEGQAAAAAWRDSPLAPEALQSTGTITRHVEIESGFGTPVLKHRRWAVVQSGPEEAVLGGDATGPSEPSRPKDTSKEGDHCPPHPVPVMPARKPRERDLNSNSLPVSSPSPRKRARGSQQVQRKRKENPGTVAYNKSMRREKEHDEEHRRRLDQRRERRRANKAIVDPYRKPPMTSSGEESDSEQNKTSRKASKKTKTHKGLHMPAGLALMHGFSATNIGKNRLTTQVDTAVGVFNKGKASARTSVKKNKPIKPHLKLFSEHRFLSKAVACPASDHPDDSSAGVLNNDNTSSSDEATTLPQSKKANARIRAQQSRKKRAKAPTSSSSIDTERAPSPNRSPARKRLRATRPDSPTWDIELEEGKLPSGSDSATSVSSRGDTKFEGTVILDTRSAACHWASAMQGEPAGERKDQMSNVHATSESETSSISPSNSASQAPLRRSQEPPNVVAETLFSKYFSTPGWSAPQPTITQCESPPARTPSPGHTQPPSPGALVNEDECIEDSGCRYPPEPAATLPEALEDNCLGISHTGGWSSVASPVGSATHPLLGSPSGILSGPPSPVLSESLCFIVESNPRSSTARVGGRQRRARDRRHDRSGLLDTSQFATPSRALHSGQDDFPKHTTMNEDVDIRLPRANRHRKASRRIYAYFSDSSMPVELPMHGREAGEGSDTGDYLEDPDDLLGYPPEVPGDFGPAHAASGYGLGAAEHSEDVDDARFSGLSRGGPGHGGDWGEGELLSRAQLTDGTFDEEPYVRILEEEPNLEEALHGDVYFLETCDAEDSGDMVARHGGPFAHYDFDGDFACDPEAAHPEVPCGEMATAMDLDDDLGSESESDQDRSVLGSLQRFSQGRALLLGVSDVGLGGGGSGGASRLEEDVARNLKGHWQPQRF
ncbi:hypothetical protein C8Q77DRAFT_1205910 [Trametes polyzona]|nr:hypothetical protein C8Q77DRAFT_1205910 [Trametes polyzona]